MTALVLSLFLAALFLFALFSLAFQWANRMARSQTPGPLNLPRLLSLSALFYPRAHLLFDRTDFDYLRRIGAHAAAAELRKDRKEAALLWLRGLKADMQRLLLFQRCLARVGIQPGTRTGLSLIANILLFYAAYGFLYFSVLTLGPYALPRMRSLVTDSARFVLVLLGTLSSKLPAPLPEPIKNQLASDGLRVQP